MVSCSKQVSLKLNGHFGSTDWSESVFQTGQILVKVQIIINWKMPKMSAWKWLVGTAIHSTNNTKLAKEPHWILQLYSNEPFSWQNITYIHMEFFY